MLSPSVDVTSVVRCWPASDRYALIDEPLTGSSATICGGAGNGIGVTSGRERHVYTSRSHRVRVQLLHTNNGAGYLLKFEGRGVVVVFYPKIFSFLARGQLLSTLLMTCH